MLVGDFYSIHYLLLLLSRFSLHAIAIANEKGWKVVSEIVLECVHKLTVEFGTKVRNFFFDSSFSSET